ncbi:acyltransferase [Actinomadura barringtoniae]|uniref:Acyltransferase n=1 Tax=Actinomadura barringtoniae TaxID=1427535 RepID=A0A939TFG5_9ACTN|nr:acyltransferase [Actinomadura barringtoniae]MBO2454345.1 acyltransferase [Actinomadura barringtoniae]
MQPEAVPSRGATASAELPNLLPRQPRGQGRLRELDTLRFVAAAAVMMHHFVARSAGWGPENYYKLHGLSQITQYGNLGVDLFFLISGFVILMSSWGRTMDQFAASRIVRIFPAYWFAVVLALVLWATTGVSQIAPGPEGRGPLDAFLPNLTMLQEGVGAQPMEGVYWTLWVELHFYILIAFLIWRGITYRRCVTFMVAWLLAGLFAQESDFKPLIVMLFPIWAPYFVAGMAFYLMWRFGPNLVLGLITLASWAMATYYRTTVINPDLKLPPSRDLAIPIGVTLAFLIMALVATRKLSWLGWRGGTVLGALTYPLYLVHETIGRVLWEFYRDNLTDWQLLGLCIAVALPSAYIVYRLVEVPSQKVLRPRMKAALARIREQSAAALDSKAPSRSASERMP